MGRHNSRFQPSRLLLLLVLFARMMSIGIGTGELMMLY